MTDKVTIAQEIARSGDKYRKECLQMPYVVLTKNGTLNYMRSITPLIGKETEGMINPAGEFRPYRTAKDATDPGYIDARSLETFHMELLQEFDAESIYTTIYGTPLKKVQQITSKMVQDICLAEMRKASEGLSDTVWRGVRNASGDHSLDNFDGFDTILKREREAGNLDIRKGNYVNLSVLTRQNIGDKLRAVWELLDDKLRGPADKKIYLYLPESYKLMYEDWYADNYDTAQWTTEYNQKYLIGSGTKCELVSLPGMEGMEHIFFSTKENLKFGSSGVDGSFSLRVPDNPKVVQLFSDCWMGVEFAAIKKEFIFVCKCEIEKYNAFGCTDLAKVVFDTCAVGATSTKTITFFGLNMKSAVAVESSAATVTLSSASLSVDAVNSEDGAEVTLTFTPTAVGDVTGKITFTNEDQNYELSIPFQAKATAAASD